MRRTTYRPVGRVSSMSGNGRAERVVVTAALVVVALVAVRLATMGSMLGIGLAIGASLFVVLLSALGTERTGTLTIAAAFVTAPVYKGVSPSPDSPVTPTDLLFVIGFGLLLPTMLKRRVELPFIYLIGLLGMFVAGIVGSLVSDQTYASLFALTLWLVVVGGLPSAMALWGPTRRTIDLLLWSYVGGHMVSVLVAFKDGPGEQGRYGGLATHYNYFAQAGLLSVAILLYLFHRATTWPQRWVVIGAGIVSAYSIQMSGSRAAIAVMAVLILMVPIVERSAVLGFLLAMGGALAFIALPLLVSITGEDSALGRLAGGGGSGAQYSNQAREMGRDAGIARFFDHPLTGSGVVDLFDIHNNYLEAAVAIGVFGLVAFLLVLFTFARPLFGNGPDRRLCYAVWAYIGFGATTPGLYDRGIWAPVSLSILAAISWWNTERRAAETLRVTPAPATVPS